MTVKWDGTETHLIDPDTEDPVTLGSVVKTLCGRQVIDVAQAVKIGVVAPHACQACIDIWWDRYVVEVKR